MTVDSSQRIYINIKLEERLDHRVIVADADLEAVSYSHLTLPTNREV